MGRKGTFVAPPREGRSEATWRGISASQLATPEVACPVTKDGGGGLPSDKVRTS